jgi:hypothetical protein
MRTKIEKQNELESPELAAIDPLKEYIWRHPKRLNYPYLTTRDTSPSRANSEVFRFSSSDGCPATATSASKHLDASDQSGQTTPLGG